MHALNCSLSASLVLLTFFGLVHGNSFPCGQLLTIEEGADEDVKIPWTATIFRTSPEGLEEYIPALIITPSILLTDAVYFVSKKNQLAIHPFSQYQGASGSGHFRDHDAFVEMKNVSHIAVYPTYQPSEWKDESHVETLIHLESPLNISHAVQPICLPSTEGMISLLRDAGATETISTFVNIGWWKLAPYPLVSLRQRIYSEEECMKKWEGIHGTLFPYGRRFCATVAKDANRHTKCINRSLGGMTKVNGSYYLSGVVNTYYSTDRDSQTCLHDSALYFFHWLSLNGSYSWMDKNIKCGSHQFTCVDGSCIPLSQLCNRINDCGDWSDEKQGFCSLAYGCNETQFYCRLLDGCYDVDLKDEMDCEIPDRVESSPGTMPAFVVPVIVASVALAIVLVTVSLLLWRRNAKLNKTIRDMTDIEVNEFIYGYCQRKGQLDVTKVPPADDNRYESNSYPLELPWDAKYEICMDNVVIGEVLGSGNFGIVYKGTYHNQNENSVQVAVKTHLNNMGLVEFKTILKELKILAYVGTHPYIVSLYGACTQDIKKRCIYVVLEYCPGGDLRSYLRDTKFEFQSLMVNNDDVDGLSFNLQKLHRWSYQIALGMKYLSSLNIVHGDIAARNILLTDQLNAKIADFGLSRILDLSGVYIKKTKEPLPWKWMAVESLDNLEFSTKSDVWSYGVTLWEIYSFGEEPFHDYHYGPEFSEGVSSGAVRLDCPALAPLSLYQVLTGCWQIDPSSRPDFKDITRALNDILAMNESIICAPEHRFGSVDSGISESTTIATDYIERDD